VRNREESEVPIGAGAERRTLRALIADYEAVFLDAYGVLVDTTGPLPGAVELLGALDARAMPWLVVTNDASRTPETASARYAARGLAIPPERLVSSGSLLTGWFARSGLAGARTRLLGPPDSEGYVRAAGGVLVPPEVEDFDVLVIADEAGYDFLPTLDATLSALYRAFDAGRPPRLVVPNPDLVYPSAPGAFGFASGTIAAMLEAALALRHPGAPGARFERLGKPHAPIFEEAVRRVGTRRALMIGDQLATDVKGAIDFGLDAVLIGTGVGRVQDEALPSPTWTLDDLGEDTPAIRVARA
jgi:HAD superfamily hydrolase (TIGR01450 family)